MFGLFYLACNLLGGAITGVKNTSTDRDSYERAYQRFLDNDNPSRTYYDWRGTERDLTTRQKVFSKRTEFGQTILVDENGNFVRNVSENIDGIKFANKRKHHDKDEYAMALSTQDPFMQRWRAISDKRSRYLRERRPSEKRFDCIYKADHGNFLYRTYYKPRTCVKILFDFEKYLFELGAEGFEDAKKDIRNIIGKPARIRETDWYADYKTGELIRPVCDTFYTSGKWKELYPDSKFVYFFKSDDIVGNTDIPGVVVYSAETFATYVVKYNIKLQKGKISNCITEANKVLKEFEKEVEEENSQKGRW